ncbi:type II restriction endonuclease subunit M [Microbispora rosea subsp. aerata]|nr:SAM-dependent DNA methyltransferase [Microbispora rosea]GGO19477.1 type II restriction endonuclease subunit M [Microbispora rosea subsp. aerata]GIH54405.1 type II restriction endonuclease subunit M [Microbispora rosea subsp. aerata]GLJ81377.1 type II restriction endonuclease subunit M [Microbispora rosea subsp. aerata]
MNEDVRWSISYAEIATLAEVRRPVVTTWARRHTDFPKPIRREAGRPLFDGREVVDWLLATNHGNASHQRLRAELALHTLAGWRDRLPAHVLVNALTALICLRQQQDAPLADSEWASILRQAGRFDAEDTFLHAELRALAGPGMAHDAERVGTALAALADELVEAAYTPAEAFDWVLSARRRLGANELIADEPAPVLTQALARLCGIAEMEDGAILATPHARSGDLLAAMHAQAASDAGHTYLAADPDPAFTRLVRRRMLVREVYEFQLDVTIGTELALDDWGDPDVVLCALPYEPGETRDALTVLERVEAITDLLDVGRTAVVLGPADALVRPLTPHSDADRLRRLFLSNGLLKAVVSLPDGAFPYRPGYRTAVWVLTRTPERERHGMVLLADLSSRPLIEQVLDSLVEDVHIFRSAGWRNDRRHTPRHAVILPAKVLDDRPGTAFTPQHRPQESRYTRAVMERPERISGLEIRLSELVEEARQLYGPGGQAELRTHAALRTEDRPVRRTTVGRMLRERRLRRLPGHRIKDEHLISDGGYAVLTPAEVVGAVPIGGRRIDPLVLTAAYEHANLTQPGDVIVTSTPDFGVYVDEEGLCVVAYPAHILRVRPDVERPVRPRVLAALLRAASAEHRRVNGAVRASRRLEDLLIPDLTLDEAERYDALLAEIARRDALLRAQIAALEDLNRLTAAGLVDGTLTLLPTPHTD